AMLQPQATRTVTIAADVETSTKTAIRGLAAEGAQLSKAARQAHLVEGFNKQVLVNAVELMVKATGMKGLRAIIVTFAVEMARGEKLVATMTAEGERAEATVRAVDAKNMAGAKVAVMNVAAADVVNKKSLFRS
ncbi:MAG: hypothetical protein K2X27_20510, partial [Candidatus Obscuribacterales bacterium]|nr:hypothetical protein [Candidatus Obscuribacterales bacterium]